MKGYSDRDFPSRRSPDQSNFSNEMSHQRMIHNGPNSYQIQHQNPQTQRLNMNAAIMQSSMSHMGIIASQPPEHEIIQSLPVPEYKMGWIVGKRGSYINQLSKKSGAHITISDSTSKEYGTVWKYVQITGTGRAVDRAKKLLHIRLERLEPRSEVAKADAEIPRDMPNTAAYEEEEEDDADLYHHHEQVSSLTDDEYSRNLVAHLNEQQRPPGNIDAYNLQQTNAEHDK